MKPALPPAAAVIGDEAFVGGDDVAFAQRGVVDRVQRDQAVGVAAVAGAVVDHALAIGEGSAQRGVAGAVAGDRVIDAAAGEHAGLGGRAERAAKLRRVGAAAALDREIAAVAQPHAERPGEAGRRTAAALAVEARIGRIGIGAGVRRRAGAALAAEQEVKQTLGRRGWRRHDQRRHGHCRDQKCGEVCSEGPSGSDDQECLHCTPHFSSVRALII